MQKNGNLQYDRERDWKHRVYTSYTSGGSGETKRYLQYDQFMIYSTQTCIEKKKRFSLLIHWSLLLIIWAVFSLLTG